MAVHLKDKFIFLANPRTGSMATEAALLTLKGAKRIKNHHSPLEDVVAGDKGAEVVFTTVRNHWDALPSWFEAASDQANWFNFLKEWRHSHFWKLVDGKRSLWWMHPNVDYILRYENLQAELDEMMHLVRCPRVVLPRLNVTAGKMYYKDYWTPLSINWIWDNFGWEMTKYGYAKL